ncbi:putative quinol monooxygenase [Shimia sp.]|uniref:putative quinol monooxygenase n=1 Tax=Shimia sp. TaxID=1954381 RepID=UPI003B8D863C
MYAVIVTFRIKPEHLDSFLPLMRDNATTSLREELGCRTFDVWQDSSEVFLYEVYESAEAFKLHLSSSHFKKFDSAVTDMIAHKEVRIFEEAIQ